MPEIQKQSNNQTNKVPLGVLDRITTVQKVDSGGLKMSVYGRPKTGKTTLFSTFPKPSFIIGSEDGTRSIKNEDGIDFVQLQSSEEIETLVPYIRKKGYKSVALDNGTDLRDLILKEVLGVENVPVVKEWGPYWQEVSRILRERIEKLFLLTCNVFIIAQEADFRKPEGEGSELLTPTISSDLGEKTARWLNSKMDYIGQCFIRPKTITKELIPGEKTQVPTDESEYCLRIGPHSIYSTGFRVVKGTKVPNVIVNPSYQKIMNVINGQFGQKVEPKKQG